VRSLGGNRFIRENFELKFMMSEHKILLYLLFEEVEEGVLIE